MFNKVNKNFTVYLVASLALFSFIFRDLILNISTNLIDWRDYAYVVWVINQAIDNFTALGAGGIFNGNAFYPNQNILLFSDLLWPQALITAFFSLFTKNIILQFNLMFLTTLILNTLSIFVFWRTIFEKEKSVVFASLLTNFSPFFFIQLSHFQMISYWPFFLALSYLFKNKKSIKDILLIGLFLSIQFYAAVYWAIFLLTVIGIYYLVKIIKKNQIIDSTKLIIMVSIIFLILVGPVLFKYIQTKKAYQINRSYSEYVTYSAHMSDYLFNSPYRSLLSNSKIFKKINSFNNHRAGEIAGSPSLVVIFLGLIGLLVIRKNRKELSFKISIKEKDLFFLILSLTGLVLSLGPRLSFNGEYLAIPLPFDLALKYLVIFDPIRATARLSALFYIGAFYFATKGLEKINRKGGLLLISVFTLVYLLELIPTNLKSEFNDYYPETYQTLANECLTKPNLIEYPFNQNFKGANVATNLTYKASQLTASVNTDCNLINGYAGFDPQDYTNYISTFNQYLEATDAANLKKTITEKKVNFIKVNKKSLSNDSLKKLDNVNIENDFGKIMINNDHYLLIETDFNESK